MTIPVPQRMPIFLTLQKFGGPLDLLLYLIQTSSLDISTLSISKITADYLLYVQQMQNLNFDLASEYLVIAATLLYWKSKAVLPQEPSLLTTEHADTLTPEALVAQLQEYKKFQMLARQLEDYPMLGIHTFKRIGSKIPIERRIPSSDITYLLTTYQNIVIRRDQKYTILKKETVSITDKILELRHYLIDSWLSFDEICHDITQISHKVATFLAVLELCRLKKCIVLQEKTYGALTFKLVSSLENFDLSMAIGFDMLQSTTSMEASC